MIYDLITVGRDNMDCTHGISVDDGVMTDHVARKPGKLTSLAPVGVQPSNHFPRSFSREDPAEIHPTVEEAEHLSSAETRALLLSGNAFSRGPV